MNPYEYVKNSAKDWDSRLVYGVGVPLPPSPAQGWVIMADSIVSMDAGIDRNYEVELLDITINENTGPLILFSVKVGKLLSIRNSGNEGKPVPVEVSSAAFCATSTCYKLNMPSDAAYDYATDTRLERVQLTRKSCHHGSHFCFPNAPALTALVQHSISSEEKQFGIPFLDPNQGAELFPKFDFSENGVTDSYIKTLPIFLTDIFVKFGLGEWAIPYLKELRNNTLRCAMAQDKRSYENEVQRAFSLSKTQFCEFGHSGFSKNAAGLFVPSEEDPLEDRLSNFGQVVQGLEGVA